LTKHAQSGIDRQLPRAEEIFSITSARVRPLVEMQRAVDAGGQPVTAAFTIARVEMGEMPEGRIQILAHRTEPLIWQPRWLSHPNGARTLTRILVAVADVAEAVRRFGRFTGRAPVPTPFGSPQSSATALGCLRNETR
jgi:hypothetical protein